MRQVLASLVLVGTAFAQNTADDLDAEVDRLLARGIPTLEVVRTDALIVVDGVLDEEAWASAAVISELTQVEPDEGALPSEKTEIRILYDENLFYLGVRCFDSEPEEIVTTQMVRDADLDPDDRIELIVDTFFDRRNAYFFQINAAGARGDGIIENSGNFNKDYDGIWYGRASIDDRGWVAEIGLPYKTLSFDPASSKWGFNFTRFIRRRNETLRWATPRQNSSLFNVGDAGILEAIHDIEQGIGLDVKPFITLRHRRRQITNENESYFEPGLDVFYKVTPSLTAAFTVNTDFAETEVDERRVNLTRFPLFFPEKRDFFLQDAGIFAFGGIRRDPLPFFSRRIGIGPDGRPVPILAGAKLTGRVGRLNVGLIDVQTDDTDGVEGKNLAVARLAMNVLDESTVGVIATRGDSRSNDENALVGADFNFRSNSVLADGNTITGAAFVQKTFTEGVSGGEEAFGARIELPNDRINFRLGAGQTGSHFNPGLGFTQRLGIREYFTGFRYRIRPGGYIRTLDTGFGGFLITNLDNEIESLDADLDLITIGNDAGDEVALEYSHRIERLFQPFEIMDGVLIDAGRYTFHRYTARLTTSSGRPVSGSASISVGSFFDGHRIDLEAGIEWRPSRHLFLGLEVEQNDVELDGGAFITRVGRARINVYFTPDVSWITFVQYDDVSDLVGINSRLRWIVEPGSEVFFVVNQGFSVDRAGFRSATTEITAKVGWTFRF